MSVSNPLTSPATRPLSRPSSRASFRSARAPSPSALSDDPVAVRTHMSTLKHTIRHQQAQLHTLENIILRGPRPLPPGMISPPRSPDIPEVSPSEVPPTTTTTKMQRRSSFDVLLGLAGPDSSLPLPKRDSPGAPTVKQDNGIREGVPMDFGVGPVSPPSSYKRVSSPTRTLSRIPVASVGNARALADEGQPATQRPSKHSPVDSDSQGTLTAVNGSASTSSLQPPPSPNRRLSLTPGGTTKVLAELQTGVVNARNALENTKAQLRLSQRSVAQLTRQTEDLKEGRERLRLENEGLNSVVARKERLLQEVLERARKAEADATSLKSQLKTETTNSKKALREMEAALSESTALSQKSEREYITLRDSIQGLVDSWKTDTERLREEMRKREEKWRKEAELVGSKYKKLVEDVRTAHTDRAKVTDLRVEVDHVSKEIEDGFREEIERLKAEVEQSSEDSETAGQIAKTLAAELARLRRLIRTGESLGSTPA